MGNKRNLFLDFDNTVVQSTKAFVTTYNEIYKSHKDFKFADWEKVNKWNFSDECNLVEDVEGMFADYRFFSNLELIDENMRAVMLRLSEKFNVTIVSIGTYKNIALKALWIEQNLPFIQNSCFIVNNGCKMDKSLISMGKDDIIVDDHQDNLYTSSAGIKICFADLGIKEWNKDWQGVRVKNSLELEKELEKYL